MTAEPEPNTHGPADFIFICPSYLECVLAAGNEHDIETLREWCADLPLKSYGRVFVEVSATTEPETFAMPPGVGITWVRRGADEAPGVALRRATSAWFDEWLRGDPLSGRVVRLLPGALDAPGMIEFWQGIELELAEMTAAAAEYRSETP